MIYTSEMTITQTDKHDTLKSASYVRADDDDYFVVSYANMHIAYVLSTQRIAENYTTHEVCVAAQYATFKDAVAHVDVQYHIDTCENDALNRAMSHALAFC